MSLSTFCDLVWAEIWDDSPPLGDQSLYRDIMIRLFIDGDEPHTITWVDSNGKTQRLTSQRGHGTARAPSKQMLDQARALHEQLKAARDEAKRLASADDGG